MTTCDNIAEAIEKKVITLPNELIGTFVNYNLDPKHSVVEFVYFPRENYNAINLALRGPDIRSMEVQTLDSPRILFIKKNHDTRVFAFPMSAILRQMTISDGDPKYISYKETLSKARLLP